MSNGKCMREKHKQIWMDREKVNCRIENKERKTNRKWELKYYLLYELG